MDAVQKPMHFLQIHGLSSTIVRFITMKSKMRNDCKTNFEENAEAQSPSTLKKITNGLLLLLCWVIFIKVILVGDYLSYANRIGALSEKYLNNPINLEFYYPTQWPSKVTQWEIHRHTYQNGERLYSSLRHKSFGGKILERHWNLKIGFGNEEETSLATIGNWLSGLFYYPGDSVIDYLFLKMTPFGYFPDYAAGILIYGGWLSGVISLFLWGVLFQAFFPIPRIINNLKTVIVKYPIVWGPSLFSFIYYCDTLTGMAVSYRPDELPYVLSVLRLTIESFKNFTLPLWNPMIGPGGHPAIPFASIPWDYRIALQSISDEAHLIFFDFMLMSYTYAYGMKYLALRNSQDRSPLILLTLIFGLLYYYHIGMLKILFVDMKHRSVFIAYPLLAGLIYIYEKEMKHSTLFAIGLVYWYSFHGGRIDFWMQMSVISFFTVFACRIALNEPFASLKEVRNILFLHATNKKYLLVAFLVWLAHLWDLHWVFTVISESGRTEMLENYGILNTTQDFFKSFYYSFTFNAYLPYLFFNLIVLSSKFKLSRGAIYSWELILGFLGLLIYIASDYYKTLDWASNEIPMLGDNPFLLSVFLTSLSTCYIYGLIKYFKGDFSFKGKLLFDLPAIALMILHFAFASDGHSLMTSMDSRFTALFLVVSFLSFFSSQRVILKIALIVLISNYLLRAHLSVFTMKLWNFPWHIQRDDPYFCFWLSVLFVLGTLWFLQLRAYYNERIYSVFVVVLFFWSAGYFQEKTHSQDYFNKGNRTEWYTRAIKDKIIVNALDKYSGGARFKRVFLDGGFDYHATTPFLLENNIFMLRLSDSTASRYFREYLHLYANFTPMNVSARCRFSSVSFAYNIRRLYEDCHDIMHSQYSQKVAPNDSITDNPEALNLLGTQFVISNKKRNEPYLHFLEEIYPGTYLYANIDLNDTELAHLKDQGIPAQRAYNFLAFHPWPEADTKNNCVFYGTTKWERVNGFSDINSNKPLLRSEYSFYVEAPTSGCVMIKLGYSKLWQIQIDGKTVIPKSTNGVFITVPVSQGNHSIVARYHPYLKYEMAFSMLVFMISLYWGFRNLFKNRSVSTVFPTCM